MPNKYSAKKTEVDGITFDSKLEALRYQQLAMLERQGEIHDLKLQVEFQIEDGFKNRSTGEKIRSTHYIADFTYYDKEGRLTAEDTKGMETKEFKLKWKQFQSRFPYINAVLIFASDI